MMNKRENDVSKVISIDFNTRTSKKEFLEALVEDTLKKNLNQEDVSVEMENQYTRTIIKFEALSFERQLEILNYVKLFIMEQRENLSSQMWNIIRNLCNKEGAVDEVEAHIDKALLKEQRTINIKRG